MRWSAEGHTSLQQIPAAILSTVGHVVSWVLLGLFLHLTPSRILGQQTA